MGNIEQNNDSYIGINTTMENLLDNLPKLHTSLVELCDMEKRNENYWKYNIGIKPRDV